MSGSTNPEVPGLLTDFPLSFRFQVTFFLLGILPNPLDVRFQKVSGLTSEVQTEAIGDGGQNLYTQYLPQKVNYQHLQLERGFTQGSILNTQFNLAMSTFTFTPGDVMVSLLNEEAKPVSAWMFLNAYPVKWSVSDLDANAESIVIDRMELAFDQYLSLRL